MFTEREIAYFEACNAIGDALHAFPEDMDSTLRRLDEDGFAIVRIGKRTIEVHTGASCQRYAMAWGMSLAEAEEARNTFLSTGQVEFNGFNANGEVRRIKIVFPAS